MVTPKSEEEGLDSYTNLMEAGYGKVWNVYGEEGRKSVLRNVTTLHDLCERIINSDSRFKNKTSIHWFMLALLNKVKVKGI